MKNLIVLLLFSYSLFAQISRPTSYSDQAIAAWMIDEGEYKRRTDLNSDIQGMVNSLRPYRTKITGNQYTESSQAYADRSALHTRMNRYLNTVDNDWSQIGGYRLDFLDQIDCARYVTAYDNASDFLTNVYIDEIRNEYNKIPVTFMMNPKEIKADRRVRPNSHPLIDNVARGLEDNALSRYFNDQASEYAEYSDSQIVNSRTLDPTFRKIVFSLNKRASKSTENEYLRKVYRTCKKEIKISLYSSMMSRLRAVGKSLKTEEIRQQNILVEQRTEELACQSFYRRAKQYVRFDTDILGANHEFFQKYSQEQLRVGAENLQPAKIFEYIGHALDMLPESDDIPALYTSIRNMRVMADVLFCAEYIDEDSEILKNIDQFLRRAVSDYHAKECSPNAFEEIDTQFFNRRAEVARFYDFLPSTGETSGYNFTEQFVEQQKRERNLQIQNILDRIGKDFIDRAVRNLLVTGYMYDFNVEVSDALGFGCEGSNTSTLYCLSFKRYIQERFQRENETTIARIRSSGNHPQILNCGGQGAISAINDFYSEQALEPHMKIQNVVEREDGEGYEVEHIEKKLLKNDSYGFRSVGSDYKEALVNAVFQKTAEVARMEDYKSMIPLMFSQAFVNQFEIVGTDVFMTHGHPQAPPTMYYRTMELQRVDASCTALKLSLKEAMVRNVTDIANPTSFSSLFGFIELDQSFYKNIARRTAYITEFFSTWDRDEAVDNVDSMFNLVPGLQAELDRDVGNGESKKVAKYYVKHLSVLLKHSQTDEYGRSIKLKYLNEFKGRAKFICAIYDQIEHENTVLDPYVNKKLEVFYAVTKAVAALVTIAGWIVPPAGAALTTLMAFAFSTTTSMAMISKYQAKMDSYLMDRNLALQSCMEDIVQVIPELQEKLDTEDKKTSYCDSVIEYSKEVSHFKERVDDYTNGMYLETAMYAMYTIPLIRSVYGELKGVKGTLNGKSFADSFKDLFSGPTLLDRFNNVGQRVSQWATNPPSAGAVGQFFWRNTKSVMRSVANAPGSIYRGAAENFHNSVHHIQDLSELTIGLREWTKVHHGISFSGLNNLIYNAGKGWKAIYYSSIAAQKGSKLGKILYLGFTLSSLELAYIFKYLEDRGEDWYIANYNINDPEATIPDPPAETIKRWETDAYGELQDLKEEAGSEEEYEKQLMDLVGLSHAGDNA